jgi:hypothetical protein
MASIQAAKLPYNFFCIYAKIALFSLVLGLFVDTVFFSLIAYRITRCVRGATSLAASGVFELCFPP